MRIVDKVDAVQVDHFEVRGGRFKLVDVDDFVDLLLLLVSLLVGTWRGKEKDAERWG